MREAGNNPIIFTLTLLAIEFLDEFAFAARETAWPLIRTDVSLRAEGEAIPNSRHGDCFPSTDSGQASLHS